MKRSIPEIRERMWTALTSRGVAAEDAAILAEEYLEGELKGKKSHGLMAFPSFLEKLSLPFPEMEIITETHSLIIVEAKGAPGILVGRKVVDRLVEKAREEGAAVGLIKNMKSWLRPGSLARTIAERGMVGFVT